MVVYNVTVKIDEQLHEDWLSWMKQVHIPEVLETGAFIKCRIAKIDLVETDGVSYAIQYDCYSADHLNKYMIQFAPTLQKKHIERYANRFVAFRTVLEVLEELYPKSLKS